jgi:hypothetical protein
LEWFLVGTTRINSVDSITGTSSVIDFLTVPRCWQSRVTCIEEILIVKLYNYYYYQYYIIYCMKVPTIYIVLYIMFIITHTRHNYNNKLYRFVCCEFTYFSLVQELPCTSLHLCVPSKFCVAYFSDSIHPRNRLVWCC